MLQEEFGFLLILLDLLVLKPFSLSSPFSITRFFCCCCLPVLLTRASLLALAKSIYYNQPQFACSGTSPISFVARGKGPYLFRMQQRKQETSARRQNLSSSRLNCIELQYQNQNLKLIKISTMKVFLRKRSSTDRRILPYSHNELSTTITS